MSIEAEKPDQTPQLALAARASNRQRLQYKITPSPDSLMTLKSIGGQLQALGELFEAIAKDHGEKVLVGLAGIAMDQSDGSITFDVLVLPLIRDKKKP